MMHGQEPQQPQSPRRALLVEGGGPNQLIARRFLARLGYQVEVADAQDALRRADAAGLDLVMADIRRFERDGLLEVQRLRERGKPELVVLALGSPPSAAQLRSWKAAGVDGQLDRPLDLEGLQRELARCERARQALPPQAAPALDVSALLEEVGGDRTLLFELAALFEEQAALRVQELGAAVAQADAEAIDHCAHALKSMIGLWQRGAAYELAASLERIGRERRLEDSAHAYQHLSEALGQLLQNVHTLVHTGEHG